MIRAYHRIAKSVAASLRQKDGSALTEFVLVVPLILAIIMSSFKSGLLMTR